MNYTLFTIFTFSIGISAILAWIRFKKIDTTYYPFIFCISIALFVEILSYVFTHTGRTAKSNAVVYNIYALLEAILITWQFEKWNLFYRLEWLFKTLIISFAVFWVVECFFFNAIHSTTSYFRFFYSAIVVIMSVNVLNKELMTETKNIFKNPIFLICLAFMVYYFFEAIIVIFWLYGYGKSTDFLVRLILVTLYLNFIANLVYALAVLWMPRKNRFLLQY